MDLQTKIIIVDDHPIFREGMKLLIEMEGIGRVIAEAENGQVFLKLLENLNPDLVILDIEMPVMGGLEATRKAIARIPDLKILVVTMTYGKEKYSEIKTAGAKGFVLKSSGKLNFEKAIKALIRGENYFSDKRL